MSILDEIRAGQLRQGPDCPIGAALNTLDAERADALRDALADPHIYGTTIVRWLRKQGMTLGNSAAARHRAEGHSCH